MIWGDKKLKKLIEKGDISPRPKFTNPASINLRLGDTFSIPKKDQVIKLGEKMQYDDFKIKPGETFPIRPGQFLLATTLEHIIVPDNAAAFVQGRSSIGRIGLTVQNAGFVDPGFHGHITLELKNDTECTILLYPGYPVTQLVYMDVKDNETVYEGKYNGQVDATGSRMQFDHITPESAAKDIEQAVA